MKLEQLEGCGRNRSEFMDSLKVVDYRISILEMFGIVCLKIVPVLPKIIKTLDFCIK